MPVDLISLKMVDAAGKTKSAVFPTASGSTISALGTFVTVIAPDLDAITDCQILEASVQVSLPLPGTIKGAPVALSRVNEGALFAFDVATSEYNTSIYIPGLVRALASGEVVPYVDPGLIKDFIDQLLGGPGVTITDKHANALTAFLGGSYRFRK